MHGVGREWRAEEGRFCEQRRSEIGTGTSVYA